MGLFNFNRAKSRANQSETKSSTGWDTLRDQAKPTEQDPTELVNQTEQLDQAETARQERKALGMALYGKQAIAQPDINISQQDREQVYDWINQGTFGPTEESTLLQQIAPPSHTKYSSTDQVFSSLSDKHSRRIFAFTNGIADTPDNLRNLSSAMVDTTLAKYPTPIEFHAKAQQMLDRLRATNPAQKVQEYARDLETFQSQLYGKRYEYYKAFQALEKQAAAYQAKKSEHPHTAQEQSRATHQAFGSKILTSLQEDDSQPSLDDLFQQAAEAELRRNIADGRSQQQDDAQLRRDIEDDRSYQSPEVQAWQQPYRPQERPQESSPSPNTIKNSPEHTPVKPVDVYRLTPAESERYLREGRIDGDPFMQNGVAYQLTPDYLRESGLAPEYTFQLGDQASIGLSKIYSAQGRDSVVAYVRTPKGTKIVSYYRSGSQGTWRYLPDYVNPSYAQGSIEWYGKGYSEESVNLPAITQQALEIVNSQPHLQNDHFHPVFTLAGTAKRYESKDDYGAAMSSESLRGTFYQETSHQPSLYLGAISRYKQPPEQLNLPNSDITPDFQQPGPSYSFQSSVYGPATTECFHSHDGQLTWAFSRDQHGRAWIGDVEVESPINSVGLHTEWAQIGDYGTPLYDYDIQAGGYGDFSDTRGGRYVCMWKNYLSHMPLIQKYLNYKNSRK